MLVGARLPRLQRVADVHSRKGVAAVGLPDSYPLEGDGSRVPHETCQQCEWLSFCHQGCPKFRHAQNRKFEDLDYFCQSYKMIYSKAAGPLRDEVKKLLGDRRPAAATT